MLGEFANKDCRRGDYETTRGGCVRHVKLSLLETIQKSANLNLSKFCEVYLFDSSNFKDAKVIYTSRK